jgi:shikimate dehydrogenase
MMRFGLVGKFLGHSYSRDHFVRKFRKLGLDAEYRNYELSDIGEITELLKDREIRGLNVTVPYKESVMPFLDEVDPVAKEVGAVNTIVIRNGKSRGYNTDVIGFELSLKPFLEHGMHKALVLGTGGAAKAVGYVLKKIGLEVLYVSRKPIGGDQINYETCNANAVKWHRLIVNTTPVGMFPNIDDKPRIDYDGITRDHLLYDLIYNPGETEFLKQGRLKEAKTLNGLDMLKIQAEKSWELWSSAQES